METENTPKDKEKKEIERRLKDCNMEGFITGMDRSSESDLIAFIDSTLQDIKKQ